MNLFRFKILAEYKNITDNHTQTMAEKIWGGYMLCPFQLKTSVFDKFI